MNTTDFGTQEVLNIITNEKIEYLSAYYPLEKLKLLSQEALQYLYNKTQPRTVTIASLEHKPVESYLVNSGDGFVPVAEWRNKGNKPCIRLITDHSEVIASTDHFFEMANGKWKYAKYILPGESVKTQWGDSCVTSVETAGEHTVYDFHIKHKNHRYYTNGISSHNSGAGKSLFLANLGVNWALLGMNVLYLTFELSENLVSMRVDSMVTGISTKDVFKSIDDVVLKVKMIGKKSGAFQVKYMPSGKNANDIRSFLKEYEIKTGRRVDVLLIDYLDLMMPVGVKISPSDLFVKDKYVSEELRNLAMELNTVFVTASQLNRSAVEEIEFDHSHISGGLSKIQTADNVIGIFTSRAMRERGRYQIQLMKTRSSSGVGSKIDLEFNVDTLRISSCEQSEGDTNVSNTVSSNISNILKRTSQTQENSESAPVKAEINSVRMRSFLNDLSN